MVNEIEPVSQAWAGGIDLCTARGAEWTELMAHANGEPARLQQIAAARGFRRGWVYYASEAAQQIREEKARRLKPRGGGFTRLNRKSPAHRQ